MQPVPLRVAVYDGLVHQTPGDELLRGGQLAEELLKLRRLFLLVVVQVVPAHVDVVGRSPSTARRQSQIWGTLGAKPP